MDELVERIMHLNNKDFRGEKSGTLDSVVGGAAGFHYEEGARADRHKVADTGSWLTGRVPRFSPSAFGMLNRDGGVSRSTFLPS